MQYLFVIGNLCGPYDKFRSINFDIWVDLLVELCAFLLMPCLCILSCAAYLSLGEEAVAVEICDES